MADPLLGRLFPEKDLNQAVAVAAMCLQEEAEVRPLIADVMTALSFLSTIPDENLRPLPYPPEPEPEDDGSSSDSSDSSDSDTESRKIGKDGASANFTSARNHDTDTSDDEEEDIDSSNRKPKKKKGNKESEQKRVVFKDDVQPQPNHTRKNSSSSSDGGSSPRSSNASDNERIDSLQSSRDSEGGGGDSSFKLQNEPLDNVHSTDSALEHISSRESQSGNEEFEARNYSSDCDDGTAHGDED